jgi:ferrous iron transport protein A
MIITPISNAKRTFFVRFGIENFEGYIYHTQVICIKQSIFKEERIGMKLTDAKEGYRGRVLSMDGDSHMISRAVSIGIVPGGIIKVFKNKKKQPVLIYSRDSMIALNREDAANIIVE